MCEAAEKTSIEETRSLTCSSASYWSTLALKVVSHIKNVIKIKILAPVISFNIYWYFPSVKGCLKKNNFKESIS